MIVNGTGHKVIGMNLRGAIVPCFRLVFSVLLISIVLLACIVVSPFVIAYHGVCFSWEYISSCIKRWCVRKET
jgi:hypothetical protein